MVVQKTDTSRSYHVQTFKHNEGLTGEIGTNENPINLDFGDQGGEQIEDNTQPLEPQGDASVSTYVTRPRRAVRVLERFKDYVT